MTTTFDIPFTSYTSSGPSWSPDGKQLAFQRSIVNSDCHGAAPGTSRLWLIDLFPAIGTPIQLSPTGGASRGTHAFTLTVEDGRGGSDSDTVAVTVEDRTPPDVTLPVTPTVLWPPNHRMVSVTVVPMTTDNCDRAPICAITQVMSNEPIDGLGDGDTAPDWIVSSPFAPLLRAERSGRGDGRVYTINVTCSDAAGNQAAAETFVRVPKSQGGQ